MPSAANEPSHSYEKTSTDVGIVRSDTPLRLEDAVKIAFPMGGITVKGLRKEIDKGNLVVEKIANKLFTTLGDIEKMREKCRKERERVSGAGRPEKEAVKQCGSSETQETLTSAQASLLNLVNESLPRKRSRSSART